MHNHTRENVFQFRLFMHGKRYCCGGTVVCVFVWVRVVHIENAAVSGRIWSMLYLRVGM